MFYSAHRPGTPARYAKARALSCFAGGTNGNNKAMTSVICAVDIDRPLTAVYAAWTRSPRIPTFMGGTAERRPADPVSVDWVTMVEGRSQDFQAEVDERVDEERISWTGRERPHAGVVSFAGLGGTRARVRVELDWEPGTGNDLVDRLILRRQLQNELDGFRHDVLSGPTGDPPERRTPVAADPSRTSVTDSGESSQGAPGGPSSAPRGRDADSPKEIPAKGWLEILKRTAKQLMADNVSIVAGGVAFYVFVALVPTLIAVISLYGLVADPIDVSRQLGPFLSALPPEAAELVRTQVEAITSQEKASLGLGLVVGVVVALLGASKGMLALVSALNIAYDEQETRKFVRLRGLALLLTVGLAVAAVVGLGGMVVVRNLAERLGTFGETAVSILRWPALAMLVVLGLAALYRYAPDRAAPKWRWVTPGALAATVLWLVGSIAFSVYVRNFGTYNETYGTLGAVVVLLLWLLLTAYAIVLGAEFDAETERQTTLDSTRGTSQPLGQRGAYAADSVGSEADLAEATRR